MSPSSATNFSIRQNTPPQNLSGEHNTAMRPDLASNNAPSAPASIRLTPLDAPSDLSAGLRQRGHHRQLEAKSAINSRHADLSPDLVALLELNLCNVDEMAKFLNGVSEIGDQAAALVIPLGDRLFFVGDLLPFAANESVAISLSRVVKEMQLVTGRQRVMHARFFTTDELELLRHQNHIAAAEHRQQQMTETDSQVRARHVRVFSLAQGVCMSFLGLFVGRLLLTYMHSHSQQTQDSFRQAFQIRSEQHAATAQSLMLELESSLRLEEKPSGGFTERGYSIKQLHLGFELIKEIFEMNEILLPKKALWDFNKSEITSATMIDAIMFPMLAFATLSLINYFVLKLSRGT